MKTIHIRIHKHLTRLSFLGLNIAMALALMPRMALAVHDLTFQLDGDVLNSTTTSVGGTTQLIDWNSLINSSGATILPLPNGYTAVSFDRDFATKANGSFSTSDDTTFATGSKDTLSISPGWQCNHDANVNSKIDVMNSYAAKYTAANGDEILYFGLERNVNTGDANVGFWFLQDDVGCASTDGAQPFTGNHMDGDLLIVSAFSNGGKVSTINVYRWNGDDNTGSLGTTPVATGVDCRDPATGVDDAACAVANTAAITTPWLTAAKSTVGNSLPVAQFFEGGVNLTNSGLGGKCFNVFLGEELLFRGVLLPKMEGVFGRWSWVANGVLFACFHVHQPWTIAENIVSGAILAYPSWRFRSTWMSVIVHSVQNVFFGLLLLGIMLGLA